MASPGSTPTWREWARRWLPPALVDLARPPAPPRANVTWRGVYSTLRDVPAHRGAFEDEVLDDLAAATRAARDAQRAGADPILWHEPLTLVAGEMAAATRRVSVLDFGGGTGSGFVQLTAALPRDIDIHYTVIDTPQVCTAGRALFDDDPRIRFAHELSPLDRIPDLVYVNSALQYVDDYAAALQQLAAIGAPRLLLARLQAWRGETFATAQVNLPARTFANWWIGVDEVTAILAGAGYGVIADTVPDKRHAVDLPASHRAERPRTMLFARLSSGRG